MRGLVSLLGEKLKKNWKISIHWLHGFQNLFAEKMKGKAVSLDTIDKVLKAEGFAPLSKRTRMERLAVSVPEKIEAPKSVSLELTAEKFITEHGAGPLVFLPLIEKLGVAEAIKSLLALVAQDPSTGNLSYSNAEVKHRNQSDAVFDFVDFWKQGRSVAPKMLIFDSKFTTLQDGVFQPEQSFLFNCCQGGF